MQSSSELSIGPYRLIASLGRGGMADVFLAVRRGPAGFSKLIVIKRIRSDIHDDGTLRSALVSEARLAARLQHPNVVQTFETGEDRGRLFIAMEFLDGQSLHRVVSAAYRELRPMSVGLSARIMSDVLSALHYAHDLKDYDGRSLEIIHRDVSPQNIFLTYEGEVKLVDFGIAKAAMGGEGAGTEFGTVKGKPAYMAPEQARGLNVDRRVDVFAAGIVLWEMLSYKRLFRGDTQAESIQKLLLAPIPPLCEVAPNVPAEVGAVADRALSRVADERFPTAAAMRDALDEAVERSGQRKVRREEVGSLVSELFEKDRRILQEQVRAILSAPFVESDSFSGSLPKVAMPNDSFTPKPGAGGASLLDTGIGTIAGPRGSRRRGWFGAGAILFLVAGSIVLGRVAFRTPESKAQVAGPTASGSSSPVVMRPPDLRLCGSNTIGAELAPALVEAFLKKRGASATERAPGAAAHQVTITASTLKPSLTVSIEAAGTATAFAGFKAGKCDIGMASRAMNDDEKNALAEKGIDDLRGPATEHVIALDGIAVIVHPNNKVRVLDMEQLKGIFSGKTTDWSTVGGAPGPITVLARDAQSGTYDTFKHLALGGKDVAPTVKRFAESDQLSDAVATDANAVGFIGLAYTRSAHAIGVTDHGSPPSMPSPFTVATESYPLARRLYFYTLPKPTTPLAIELVNFAASSDGQQVVRANGFVDLSIGANTPEPCDERCPGAYSNLVRGSKRLSLDFRFRAGAGELDSRATRDLDRLVLFLRASPASKLMLLGFSDATGDLASNETLSYGRAKTVASELEARGVHAAVVKGFGAAMPVASNVEPSGRQRNRRVEVWLGE